MKLYFALFCQDARILPNGKLQIYDPIVDLAADNKPANHTGAVVVNFCPGDTDPHTLEVNVRAPYGKQATEPHKAELAPAVAPDAKVGHIIYIPELVMEDEGEFNIDVSIDGKSLANIPFDFRVVPCDCYLGQPPVSQA